AAARYDGVLVRLGLASEKAGFAIGELCWTAKASPNPALLEIQEERRSGGNGQPSQARWTRAGVWLKQITATTLVTSSGTFTRVDVPPASAPAAGLPGGVQLAAS